MKRRPLILLSVTALALILGWVWHGQREATNQKEAATLKATDGDEKNADGIKPGANPPVIADPDVEFVVHGQVSRQELLQRINGFHRRLPADDGYHLLVWATGPMPPRFSQETWAELANDTLNILRNQENPPAEMTSRIVGMFRDPDAPAVMKDYAIQHLGGWLADRDPLASWEKDAAAQKLIAEVIMEAAATVDATYAGTALYSLIEISSRLPELVSQEKMDALIITAVESPATHKLTRISALQSAAQRRLPLSLPAARRLAFDENTDASLRLSAIACLGEIGDSEDARKLAELGHDSANARLAAAIEPAIQKITFR